MNFSVDSVQVNGEAYQKIWQLIDDEQILVVAGNDPGEAHYNAKTDTIMTQKSEPPLDLFNRSVLIHECTHAIADMQFANITWLTNEATARIAQATYLLLSAPKPQIPAGYPSLSSHAIPLVKKFKLHTSAGNGAKLTQDDVFPLVRRINTETAYHKDHSIISASNGISKKDRKT